MNNVNANNIQIGKKSFIHPKAVIRGIDGPAKNIIIGDNVYIGENVQIICDDFSIGDYSKIQHNVNIHGYLPCNIGHNAWIGQFSIIDTIGGTTIGNNCGIGAHSQLWSHIKFGDTLEGCRFKEESPLTIGNDVWFVGHCIVSPIVAHDKSMALAGSVITKDMSKNEIYAGSPAKSISDKVGNQFNKVTVDEKYTAMCSYLKEFNNGQDQIKIIKSSADVVIENSISYFNVTDRTYSKKSSEVEMAFMKFLLPSKAKFTPIV